ncbi:MAG: NADH-quinone oxidoreductase subunit L [Actinomycetota bacterium]
MIDLVWLVPVVPLVGAVINLFFGRRLGRSAGILGSLVMAAAFALSVGVLADLVSHAGNDRVQLVHLFDWVTVGRLQVAAEFRVDPLAVTMMLVITGIGTLIHIYSIGYMEGDPRFGRFFAYMNLFVFFMLVLVLAANFLVLYLGWEGVGLCSYLLIGFWYEKVSAANAAKKAFITTRIGDTFFLIGIVLIFLRLGSLNFSQVLADRVAQTQPSGVFTVIALLLLGGAIGKSAQVPLHVWLPDAMEGPTPVSALIHAATMVTAGVYLIARAHIFFEISGVASTVVLMVGLVTAIYAATAALAQDDIKRVLAYSTISQLGFMFFALGLHRYGAAIFLLVTHAFYKALLFLSAGSVMHGLEGETDMTRMGGLRRYMPITSAMFIIGALAISGVPPFAGFFAKDQIVAAANQTEHTVAWMLMLLAAFFSTLYITRLVFMTFFGEYRGDGHPHESPPVMTVPLGLLAIGAVFGGVLSLNAITGRLPSFLTPVFGQVVEPVKGLPELTLTVISVAVALLGVLVGWLIWGSGRIDWMALRERIPNLRRFLANGWYIDDFYAHELQPAGAFGARFLAFGVDRGVIDAAVNATGWLVERLSSVGRRVQTGLVRNYALAFLVGVVALFVYVGTRF